MTKDDELKAKPFDWGPFGESWWRTLAIDTQIRVPEKVLRFFVLKVAHNTEKAAAIKKMLVMAGLPERWLGEPTVSAHRAARTNAYLALQAKYDERQKGKTDLPPMTREERRQRLEATARGSDDQKAKDAIRVLNDMEAEDHLEEKLGDPKQTVYRIARVAGVPGLLGLIEASLKVDETFLGMPRQAEVLPLLHAQFADHLEKYISRCPSHHQPQLRALANAPVKTTIEELAAMAEKTNDRSKSESEATGAESETTTELAPTPVSQTEDYVNGRSF